MTPYWFSKQLPASRHGIENALRLAFWAQGFGDSYFTCTQAETPVKCVGLWKSDFPLNVEWTPADYFTVMMNEPNKDALEAFERVLGHRATAAYRNAAGKVVIEWRAKDAQDRFAELEKSGVTELERLS